MTYVLGAPFFTVDAPGDMMGRGYGAEEVRRRLVEVLGSSESGMSGTELASRMSISRITLAKYMVFFEQRGLVKSRPAGNVTIWYMGREAGIYTFPDDYFRTESAYLDAVVSGNAEAVFSLVQNCIHSGARPARLVTEAVLPALDSLDRLYDEGRLGGLERALMKDIVSRSLHYMIWPPARPVPTKNCILLAAEPRDMMACRAAAAALRSEGWQTHIPGDISESADVFFDLDMRKLLGRIWKGSPGVMVVGVLGGDEEVLRFLAGSVDAVRKGGPGNIRLAFCSRTGGKRLGADMASESLEDILQWCETIHKNL